MTTTPTTSAKSTALDARTHVSLPSPVVVATSTMVTQQPLPIKSPNPTLTLSNFSDISSPPLSLNSSSHDNQPPNTSNAVSSYKTTPSTTSTTRSNFLRKSTSLLSLKKKSSTQSLIPPPTPVPELPPFLINEHYQDLTHLFDSQEPSQPYSERTTMEGLGINTSFDDGKSELSSLPKRFSSAQAYASPSNSFMDRPTIKTVQESSPYDFEYYDMDTNLSNINSLNDDTDSIQASPVDIAPRYRENEASSRQTSGMTSTTASSQTNYSVHDSHDNKSPVLQQSPIHNNNPSSPSNFYSPTASINQNKFTSLSHSVSEDKSQSVTSKVRNMFPGFGYKAVNKSPSTQLETENPPSSSPYTLGNVSSPSFVEGDPAESALVRNGVDPRYSHTREPSMQFVTRKPVPHFTEIDLGPTYKAQVIPVRKDSSTVSPVNYSSPQMANYVAPTDGEEHDNLLHSRNKSEVLDFVPNLRPSIDNVGSRLRTTGVPSPATLMMTKSQYDKYRQSAYKETDKDQNDDDEDEDEEEDSDEDEDGRQGRRVMEEDEAKKHDFRMRMKQDAHLSVYRQKMTKLTGSQIGLSTPNSASPFQTSTIPPLESFDYDSDEDYDDVPLGILKAHGFPTSGRLKTMRSQTGLNDDNLLQPPGLYGGNSKPSGDTMSLRSFQSAGPRPTTPAPEEGYLAMRNHSATNLPGFNASVPMNRGLIGEIAREEEAKAKRKTMMTNLAAQRTNTMTGSLMEQNDNASVYNAPQPQPQQAQAPGANEIQVQLHQMMQIQTQILQQMATNSAQSSPVTVMTTPGIMTPMSFQNGPPKKNWSSFDVMNTSQLQPSRGGAPSIRSFAHSEHSMRSYAGPQNRYNPGHQPHNSMPSLDVGPQVGQGFRFPNREPTPQQPPAQSSVRLVNIDDDEDEEDDEAGWEEMKQRREQLRQVWDSQPAMVS